MGAQFEELQRTGDKVGEKSKAQAMAAAKAQNSEEAGTSCVADEGDGKLGTEDEGQGGSWSTNPGESEGKGKATKSAAPRGVV